MTPDRLQEIARTIAERHSGYYDDDRDVADHAADIAAALATAEAEGRRQGIEEALAEIDTTVAAYAPHSGNSEGACAVYAAMTILGQSLRQLLPETPQP
jgi:uncharacterized protein YgbK (DUF1537 family)